MSRRLAETALSDTSQAPELAVEALALFVLGSYAGASADDCEGVVFLPNVDACTKTAALPYLASQPAPTTCTSYLWGRDLHVCLWPSSAELREHDHAWTSRHRDALLTYESAKESGPVGVRLRGSWGEACAPMASFVEVLHRYNPLRFSYSRDVIASGVADARTTIEYEILSQQALMKASLRRR